MLTYGTPPAIEDCVDLGTVPGEVVPKAIGNNGIFAGDMTLVGLYDTNVPPHRRAWLAVAYYRDADVPKPYRVKIPGLGTLLYHNEDPKYGAGDNWTVLTETN